MSNFYEKWILLSPLLLLMESIISVYSWGLETRDVTSYCESEIFNPVCSLEDEVVIMDRALYGRMHVGKCVETDYGFVGCHWNVLSALDIKCSGRRQCEIRIPDNAIINNATIIEACPKEFKTYLEANYSCLPVEKYACSHCVSRRFALITSQTGYIGSIVTEENRKSTGCGSSSCPWVIEVKKGQTINITLYDFTRKIYRRIDNCGRRYGIIKEDPNIGGTPICPNSNRVSHQYLSRSHRIEVHVISPDIFSKQGHFVLKYEALGCEEYTPPPYSWITKTDDVVTITCTANEQNWIMTCVGTQWVGAIVTCPQVNIPAGGSTAAFSLPLGVLIAIIVAIALVIGVLILTIGLVCLKRYQTAQLRSHATAAIYGRSVHGSGFFQEEMSARTPLQYGKKEQSPSTSKRYVKVQSQQKENIYMESRPLPPTPNMKDPQEQPQRVLIYPRGLSQSYYPNPQLSSRDTLMDSPPVTDPQYFVLDPEEVFSMNDIPSLSHAQVFIGGRPALPVRDSFHSDRQKSPEEENALNCSRENSLPSGLNMIPPIVPPPRFYAPEMTHNNEGNYSWP